MTPQALKSAGIYDFETLATADARKIESATGRNYPFGNNIKESLSSLPPKIDIHIEDAGNRLGKSTITVTLTRLSQAVRSNKRNFADMVPYQLCFQTLVFLIKPTRFYNILCQVVGSEEDNVILFHQKIRSAPPPLFLKLIPLTIYFPSTDVDGCLLFVLLLPPGLKSSTGNTFIICYPRICLTILLHRQMRAL